MSNVIDPTERQHLGGGSRYNDATTQAQVDARLRMESLSRVACALIFQSARDLVCAKRTEARSQARHPKVVRQARQWIEEISVWAQTIYPLLYESGGMTLAGAVETINVHQDHRGGRRIDYCVVKELLLAKPQRLAVVDGPAEFRTLTSDVSDPPTSEKLNPEKSSEDLIRVISEYEKETSRAVEQPLGALSTREEGEKGLVLSGSP